MAHRRRSHPNLYSYPPLPILLLAAAAIFLLCASPSSSAKSETEILLKFKESLENAAELSSWNPSQPPCEGERHNWEGVMCEDGKVRGLNLNGMGLKGTLDVESLVELPDLRVFAVIDNNFEGSLPDFNKMGAVKHVYLSHNKFSGEIPSNGFQGMSSLKKLHLNNNGFVGAIPTSLATLSKLIELMLENNKFDGSLPNFKQERFTMVNFSNNLLVGEIPPALSKLNASSFHGNAGLCGAPLKPCDVHPKLSTGTKAVVGMALAAALVAILLVIIILAKRKPVSAAEEGAATAQVAAAQRKAPQDEMDKIEKGSTASSSTAARSTAPSSAPPAETRRAEQSVKLSFLIEDREKFGLPDLLKASAEILGNGIFGATYKAALSTGPVMVVKRFKHMNIVGKEDFHEHMRRLGRLSNQNLLPVVAFYYRKEEKLLVSDFVDNCSLAFHLHGKNRSGSSSLDWPKRLKVVKGVAKGIAYLYTELPSLTAPHGHLKSTNVLLNSSHEPLLNDYGLLPVVNLEHAQAHMIAYKAPEFRQGGRITKKTDVWSLGILILEILTGKFPEKFAQQSKGSEGDLASWVESAIGDGEGAAEEVFDKEIKNGCPEEMMKLLKIGMSCCEVDVEKRWDIKQAVKSIEEVREK
ncbi:PREDICTED: pollen receptor-like kinase 1 [Ipomoea nil]|uniref:pollen receptor-like kinase 1 n=1 Tax=Ipomoea nil TaxID=35883 RepID=UPI000901EDF7|nr:PREDICTED: pollen receptor-like kinase 1 [Ipomoea nil]